MLRGVGAAFPVGRAAAEHWTRKYVAMYVDASREALHGESQYGPQLPSQSSR